MPVPEFNEIKAPALEFFADGKPHKISEIYKVLAVHFKLTEQDLNEVLPSGTQSRWHNRANWACYDLFRAGLLDRPKRGLYVITDLGKNVTAEKPAKIDREYLMKFPQFAKFIEKSTSNSGVPSETQKEKELSLTKLLVTTTPEEQMASLAASLKAESCHRVAGAGERHGPFPL